MIEDHEIHRMDDDGAPHHPAEGEVPKLKFTAICTSGMTPEQAGTALKEGCLKDEQANKASGARAWIESLEKEILLRVSVVK